MTEQEWLKCGNPWTMLEFLKGKASTRSLRLFAVTCCRTVEDLFPEPDSPQLVALVRSVEQQAEGFITEEQLQGERMLLALDGALRYAHNKSAIFSQARCEARSAVYKAAALTLAAQRNLLHSNQTPLHAAKQRRG